MAELRHILVVDDEPMVLQVLRRMLSSECNVSVASGVDDAMQQIEMIQFDAVIADIELGNKAGRDGTWLLSRVAERSPKTRRLLISGHHRTLEESDTGELIHAALPKPFSREELLTALAISP